MRSSCERDTHVTHNRDPASIRRTTSRCRLEGARMRRMGENARRRDDAGSRITYETPTDDNNEVTEATSLKAERRGEWEKTDYHVCYETNGPGCSSSLLQLASTPQHHLVVHTFLSME